MTTDFLNLDSREDQEVRRQKAVEFAQQYVYVFVDNPAGRQLLDHWTRTLARKRVPTDSSIQTYAATEAVRAFIEEIHSQIHLAQTEGRQ